MVHPVIVGTGQRLFDGGPPLTLELVTHEVFETGVVHLTYGRALYKD